MVIQLPPDGGVGMSQALDLIVLAAGSFIGLVALCLWLLSVSVGGPGWRRPAGGPPPHRT
jgi:hypothetical protein